MENKKKKVLLIVNPCSGRSKSRHSAFEIVDRFSKDDYEFSVHTTQCSGDATNIVRNNCDDKDLVVCCGGDGTLNETINGVMDLPRRIPIGYVPAGTTNDLASTLGIPKDLDKAVKIISEGNVHSYDIGLFNNRYYSYVASFGAFTKSSYATSQKLKNIFGHSAYVLNGVLKELRRIPSYHMRIEYDGGVIEDDFSLGTVTNSTSVGGIFRFNKNDIKLNDGIFEVLLVKKATIKDTPQLFYKVMRKQYDGNRIIFFKTSKVKITCDEEVPWTLDGEYGGEHKTVMVHVLSKAIDICSPQDNILFQKESPSNETVNPEITPEKVK